MADAGFTINRDKLWRLACRSDETYQLVKAAGDECAAKANSLGSGYRTGKYYKGHESPAIGGTAPKYESHVSRPRGIVPVSLVYTGNYAAMKDNVLHNTLLKSL